jgi:hypothetical protein
MLALALREPASYLIEPLPAPDVEGYALAWLQAQLNWHLTEYVTPSVGYDEEGDIAVPLVPLTMHPMPKHLYGALWLQFALIVGGGVGSTMPAVWYLVSGACERSSTDYCLLLDAVSGEGSASAADTHHPSAAWHVTISLAVAPPALLTRRAPNMRGRWRYYGGRPRTVPRPRYLSSPSRRPGHSRDAIYCPAHGGG